MTKFSVGDKVFVKAEACKNYPVINFFTRYIVNKICSDNMINVLSEFEEKYYWFNKEDLEIMSKGIKHDTGKLRYDLVPVDAHEALAKVFTYGAQKYEPNSWQQVESHRYEAALFRHLNEWRKGDKLDNESGLSHLAHALANVAILLWKEENDE